MDNPIHNNMDVSSEAVSEQQRRLIVSVPAAEVSGRIESRLRQIAKTAKLPGFRPGKVPMNHIRREYSYTVHQEVMDQLIRDTLFKAIEQQNVRFVGMPQIESVEDQDDRVVYKALLELYPVVSLKPFGELQIERVTSELQDSDVETMIENLRKQGQTFGDKDGAAASGDRVTIDFKGSINGELFEGGSAEGQQVTLGSGSMIPGFEDGIIGMNPGETRTIDVNFPEDYQAEQLKGKSAQFEITLHKVEQASLPEINDEFAQRFGVDSADRLQQDVRGNMEREIRNAIRNQNKQQVFDALLAANPVTVPEAMIADETERLKEQFLQRLRQQFGDFPQHLLPKEWAQGDQFREQAERDARLRVIMSQILDQNELEVDQARVDTMIEEMAQSFEDPQEVIQHYRDNRELRSRMEDSVLEDQLIDRILAEAQVSDQQMGYQDLLARQSGR